MQPVLNRSEILVLLNKARELEHEYYYVWILGFNTGCRSGELWALEWTDIDFERRLILVSKSYSARLDKVKSTKTNEWRYVPISPQLETLLKELKLKTERTGYVLPRIASWRRGEAAKVLRDFCRSIGITEIHFHAMRSCFATHCLQSGVGIPKTMKLGGWTSIKSFQHYLRFAAVDVEGATDRLNLIPEPEATATVYELKPIGL
ncbi:MAG: site-specific integrase [Bdellovibrionales bacterium]|nr:site-specific integrase [Bdellovibrionales bacterium]